jgi:hypothetical protein
VLANYIIPNECLMLLKLTELEGICITLLANAQAFIDDGSLKLIWKPESYPVRDYFLIAHKKEKTFFEKLAGLFP